MRNLLRAHPWAIIFVSLYLVLGVAYSVINPIHEATDEVRHYRYVRYIADFGKLPVQSGEQGNAQAHHPPLYYLSAAALTFWAHPADPLSEPQVNPHWSFRNWEVSTDNKNQYLHGPDEAWPYRDSALAAHLARWVTLLWGAGTVLVTYAMARTLLPDSTPVHILSMALVALSPMFLYLGAAVNNDVPAGLIGGAITLALMQIIDRGLTRRRMIVLGLLYGAALLVKFNLLAMLAAIELGLLLGLLRNQPDADQPGRIRTFFMANGIILGISLLVSGWWYVRNTILYGEPTGFLRLTEIWGLRDPRSGVSLAWRELGFAWTTLWGRFGYGQIPMPQSFYIAIGVVCGLGLLGVLIRRFLSTPENDSDTGLTPAHWQMVLVLLASVLVNLLVLYAYITVSPAGAMGRFFFPGLPAGALLVSVGLVYGLPRRLDWGLAALLSAAMLAFAMIALWGYIRPAYARPAFEAAVTDQDVAQLGDVARILDYQVSPEELQPGDELDVTVTWEVLKPTDVPYQVFIHVRTSEGVMIAQRDTYTGLGNYPSNWWQPGHVFTETYRLFLPDTAYAPDVGSVSIGLYNPEVGRQTVTGGESDEDALLLDTVTILADPTWEYPNQTFINWDGHFALVGYDIERRAQVPGGDLRFELYWQALDPPPDRDYFVFLHVRNEWENLAGNDSEPLIKKKEETSAWTAGDVYTEVRRIWLPEDIAPGFYDVELGWFSPDDGQRLNVIVEDGRIVDNWTILTSIRVVAPDPAD